MSTTHLYQLLCSLLPAKLMRDWTALFISGCPLYEAAPIDTGEPTPEQILEEERQMLLDEGDFMEYKVSCGLKVTAWFQNDQPA